MKRLLSVALVLCAAYVVAAPTRATAQGRNETKWYGSDYTPEQIATLEARYARAAKLEEDGEEYLNNKQYREAVAAFNEALTLRPYASFPYWRLGEAYTSLGQMQEAIAAYRKYVYARGAQNQVQISGSEPIPALRLALLLNQTGQWQEAVNVYQHTLPYVDRVNPDEPNGNNYPVAVGQPFTPDTPESRRFEIAARNALGIAYGKQNKEQQALDEWQKVLKLQPKNALAHFYLAHLTPTNSQANVDSIATHFLLARQYGDSKMRELLTPDTWRNHPSVLQAIQKAQTSATPVAPKS